MLNISQVATDDVAEVGAVIEAIDCICHITAQYRDIGDICAAKTLNSAHKAFDASLVDLYTTVLSYALKATNFLP